MRGAIIGFGTIAMGHAVGYQHVDGLDLVAVVDPSPARRSLASRRFGLSPYATFTELIHHENLDFIDICTPPTSHTDYLRLGMIHGLHVLCEKPVLVPADEGYGALLADVNASEHLVYPCHNYKFAPILALMESVVRHPEFGEVLNARFRTMRSGHAVGVPEWNPHWRRDPAHSAGGILRDHGPHSIYLATHLTGRTPREVSCLTGNLLRDTYPETEDTAMLTVRCNEGVQFMLDLTWSAVFRNSYYSIVGSNGSITVENDDVCYTLNGQVERIVLPSNFDDPSHTDWFRHMFADFLDRVAHPERTNEILQEALMTSLVIDAAYESAARRGRWVDISVPAEPPPVLQALS